MIMEKILKYGNIFASFSICIGFTSTNDYNLLVNSNNIIKNNTLQIIIEGCQVYKLMVMCKMCDAKIPASV